MQEGKVPALTVVVLAWNEERNLAACLESVHDLAGEIVVVDSGSTDRTLEIARRFGACVVSHPFETHARQWSWMLGAVSVGGEWIMGLDADQRVTQGLAAEIRRALSGPRGPQAETNGYYVNRRQIFRGRWIRHGGYYPKYLLKVFRRGAAWVDEDELADHHFRVRGRVGFLRGDLIEENANELQISNWIAKHNRYAVLQAREDVARAGRAEASRDRLWGQPDERVRWLKRRFWARMPLYVRPALYFVYRYVFRLGFLDGKEGFLFHFLHAYWYRLLIDINVAELRREQEAAMRAVQSPAGGGDLTEGDGGA